MSTTTFTIRTPLDFVAMAPLLLGFEPTESVMIETFGGFAGPFHARTDLVVEPGHEFEVAGMLVDAALRNGVQQVAILVYSDHPERADAQARACETAFEREAIEVIEVLRITGDRFYRICGESEDPEGTQYDLSAHRFTTQRVLEGQVVHASREELDATLDPGDPAQRREIAEAVLEWAGSPAGLPRTLAQMRSEAIWMRGRIRRRVQSGRELTPAEKARVLALCHVPLLAQVALAEMSRQTSEAHQDLWQDLVRLSPAALLPEAAALLAFAAWLHGDGALAWCALDRVPADAEAPPLAEFVATALQNAVPPSTWQPLDPDLLPIFQHAG
jgi:hypothetical protein